MFKKYIALLLAAIMCMGVFAGCTYQYAPTDISAPEAETETIAKYLNEDTVKYFTVHSLVDMREKYAKNSDEYEDDDALFDAYIGYAGESPKDLPEALVDSYVSAFAGDLSSSEEAETLAKQLIKEEMVVYLAFLSVDELKSLSFNDNVREAAFDDLKKEGVLDQNSEFVSGQKEYYAVDSYIKQQLIIAYIKDELEENEYYKAMTKNTSDIVESTDGAESSDSAE